jgi:translation initiation factor IF-2
VFPCKVKIMPECIFNKRDPIVVGVRVEAGFLKIGTPIVALCEDVETREFKDVNCGEGFLFFYGDCLIFFF